MKLLWPEKQRIKSKTYVVVNGSHIPIYETNPRLFLPLQTNINKDIRKDTDIKVISTVNIEGDVLIGRGVKINRD